MQTSVGANQVLKFSDGKWEKAPDLLAAEEPLELRLEYGPASSRLRRPVSITMRTPGNDFELAIGFLFTEGIILSYSDIIQIRHCTDAGKTDTGENIMIVSLHPDVEVDMDKLSRNFYTTSSCGICGKSSIEAVKTTCSVAVRATDWQVRTETLLQLPDLLRIGQKVFEHTGGIHACALFDHHGSLMLLREDVGRHNALDKLIGAALGSGLLPLDRNILLLSGRASFELIQKSAMAGIRFVAAVGAPSALAVRTAQEFDMTLVGFLRGRRFNVYHGETRIES